MIIYFVELESPDRTLFHERLSEHDLRFVGELHGVEPDAEALCIFMTSEIDAPFLEAHPRLRYLITRSGSVEHIDLKACRERGVTVSNVRDFGDTTVAEHTFALILALSRRLREVMDFPKGAHPARFTYGGVRGFDLAGKTLGIIGLGRIGERVAALSKAFQMEVIAYDPLAMPPERAAALGLRWSSFEELLAQSHIISLHVRISPGTHHLLDAAAFARCRPGVLIINTARGRLIDTGALAEALESGQVGGAGLDVLEEEKVLRQPASQIISAQIVEHLRSDAPPPEAHHDSRLRDLQEIVSSDALLARRNVVFTPHVAFNSVEAIDRLHAATAEYLLAFIRGAPMSLAEES